ncbi:hypothetical protein FRC10_003501 [Ceratobasidium sp. 414]|nr:hypothetical protein FRC10_003501 [Ceratobasidium sp. 414]
MTGWLVTSLHCAILFLSHFNRHSLTMEDGNEQDLHAAISRALSQKPKSPNAPAVANISNQSNELLSVVVLGEVNRIFQVSSGTATVVNGHLYYRQLGDLTGRQSVVVNFDAGMVVVSIGPSNSCAWFTGKWNGGSFPPVSGTGIWY